MHGKHSDVTEEMLLCCFIHHHARHAPLSAAAPARPSEIQHNTPEYPPNDVAVDLALVHEINGFLSIPVRVVLHVCKPTWEVDLLVDGQLHILQLAVGGKNLVQVLLSNVARQITHYQTSSPSLSILVRSCR